MYTGWGPFQRKEANQDLLNICKKIPLDPCVHNGIRGRLSHKSSSTRRILSAFELVESKNRVVKCSICGHAGHNKRTCQRALVRVEQTTPMSAQQPAPVMAEHTNSQVESGIGLTNEHVVIH